jgi:hypothetical protein
MEGYIVSSPVWANPERTAINCVLISIATGEQFPFTATPNDPMGYGRQLYADLDAGVYGPVAPYVAP